MEVFKDASQALITKNPNSVTIQIYMFLQLLQLMEVPEIYGQKLLDKLRYLQILLSRYSSISNWAYDLLPVSLVGLIMKFYV